MPNVIASATTVSNGTLKRNNFLIGVNTSVIYGPTSSTNFWNGIVPAASGYTVYAQKSSQGPSIRSASNDSELITIARQYGGININTINDALNYFNGQTNFMVTNIDYPSIVTSGLTLILDSGYVPSYPRTGTTWNDLSGNNNNGTLTGEPTFSSANGGSIVFDGSNDYVSFPVNFFNHDSGLPFTVSFWFKTSTAGVIFGQQNTNTPNVSTGYVPAIYVDSTGRIRTSCFWGGGVGNQSVSTLTVTDNAWHNIVVTFSSGSQISYLDNAQFATLSKTQTTYSSTYYYFIGSCQWESWTNTTANPFFSGSVANMIFYNRALSASEITQNFNALKSRFGL
jgi:hypothetical protein